MSMRTKFVWLTPVSAAHLLKHNTTNRPLRPLHIDNLARAMARGEWRLTHQGIAIDTHGNVLDGQHRLEAIIRQDKNFKVQMLVIYDADPETFKFVDATQLKRNVADSLRIDQRLGPVATFLHKVTMRRSGLITAAMAEPFVDFAAVEFDTLMTVCGTAVKVWSSAPVQAAAVVSMKACENQQYPADQYRALVMNSQREMSTLVEAFRKSVDKNGMKFKPFGLFARCLYAFDSVHADLTRLVILNEDIYLDHATKFMKAELELAD